jgi:hypothetical protein
MERRGSARPQWVWAALGLQCVVFLMSVWSTGHLILLWPKYAAYGTQFLPRVVLLIVETILSGVTLAGLRQSKRWGWFLGVFVDAAICALFLYSAAGFPRLILNPLVWVFNIWEFAALVVLLHVPVREYFRGESNLPGSAASPRRMSEPELHALQRSFRGLVYLAVAVAATCIVTTFSLAVSLGDKAGGGRGFVFLLVVGIEIGGAASFLFVLLLTLAARGFGPGRLGAWLIAGVLLAPGLVLSFGLLAKALLAGNGPEATGPPSMLLNILFTGPMYLFQVWWLAIPAGIVTSFFCYQMYPWVFGRSE